MISVQDPKANNLALITRMVPLSLPYAKLRDHTGKYILLSVISSKAWTRLCICYILRRTQPMTSIGIAIFLSRRIF